MENITPVEEKCAECNKKLGGLRFHLPNGKKICSECLYVKHGYDKELKKDE